MFLEILREKQTFNLSSKLFHMLKTLNMFVDQ